MIDPKVSVLMTIYNHQEFLKYSIKSILNQTYKNWELIAIDNGSTDKSKEELLKFKDKRIKKICLKKNIGRTNCLNYGLGFCKGKYIAILDSDDISLADRFKKQINFLKKNNNLSLVATNYHIIDRNNKIISKKHMNYKNINIRKLLHTNIIAHSSVMYKKSIIKKIGNYPKEYKYAQDFAFILKIFKKFQIKIIDEVLLKAREIHKHSETSRAFKNKYIVNEEIKLLVWVKKNFNLSFNEWIFLNYKYLKKNLQNLFY